MSTGDCIALFIRHSNKSDKERIANLQIAAFGDEKGPEIAKLVNDLLSDKTALPLLSLVAEDNSTIAGHILYTCVSITNPHHSVPAQILAPLAVLPKYQNNKVGSRLITEGLKQLKATGVKLVFVLGHPKYYPRHGFSPAGKLGFAAPYPIPEEHAAAWMVQELKEGIIGSVKGKVRCSEALDQPQHWKE